MCVCVCVKKPLFSGCEKRSLRLQNELIRMDEYVDLDIICFSSLPFLFLCARSGPLSSGRGERGRGTDAPVEHEQPVLARQPGGVRGEDRVENAGVAVRLFLRQFRFRGQRSGHQAGASTHRQHRHRHAGPVS